MTDLHKVVIDNVCEMVRWVTIILQNNLIVYVFVVKSDFSMYDVLERGLTLGHSHADNKRLSIGLHLVNLVLGPILEAESVILGLRILLSSDLDSHLLQPLSRAEAWIGIPIFQECVNEFVVDRQPFALEIRTMWAKCLVALKFTFVLVLIERTWAFVPTQT